MRPRIFVVLIAVAALYPSLTFAVWYTDACGPLPIAVKLWNRPNISGIPNNSLGATFKPGDGQIILKVTAPASGLLITPDLSALGVATIEVDAFQNPGSGTLCGVSSESTYVYTVGPFTIGDVPDGQKTVSVRAADALGNAGSADFVSVVDSAPPTISLDSLSFSTTSPKDGDTFTISGHASGTGSMVRAYIVEESLYDASRSRALGKFGYDFTPLNAAFASSTDGSFSARYALFDPQENLPEATSFTLSVSVYDEAGNIASTSITVPLAKPPPPPFPPSDAPVIAMSHTAIQPYRTQFDFPNLGDPKFFVASGTLSSFVAPIARFHGLTGSERYSFALADSSGLLDCKTPEKTADEWGITHKVAPTWPFDWDAPYVSMSPFSGTECQISEGASLHVVPLRPDVPNERGYLLMMGDNAGDHFPQNFIAYGPPPPPPPPKPKVDSVLFLPGIEGSRLYEGTGCGESAEEQLWEPLAPIARLLRGAGDAKVKKLSLDASGKSVCSDVYVKTRDIIDAAGGGDIYRPLIDSMDALVASTSIRMNAWEPVAYDWRLSLDDLLTKGAERGGRIYYDEATDTPYIAQELRHLAETSATGKVTIIAHSNGGLVAKALLAKLGDAEAAKLVDKLILVGAPQSGAPEDVGSLLVGYDAGIYKFELPIVSNTAARSFAQNSPMAYHLLPSEDYLESTAPDADHPVISFSGSAYASSTAAYGSRIANQSALDDFLLARAHDRSAPAESDLASPSILNPDLITYANSTHAALDRWTPPAGITVDQIAGWGNDTIAGVKFYTRERSPLSADVAAALPQALYRPLFTEDGDGTVPTPSALQMASSTNVRRYWVDLTHSGITHANIFSSLDLRSFISNLVRKTVEVLPSSITKEPPASSSSKKLIFILHSPLTLQLSDSSGNTTGLSPDGFISQNIPGAEYGQFGETQYLTAPQGSQYQLNLAGQGSGTFSLDMQESSGGTVTNTTSIMGVPTTEHTLATLSLSDGIDTASALSVDLNGDGTNVLSIAPKMGETIMYEPLPPPPPPQPPAPPPAQASSGGGGGSISFSPAPAPQPAPPSAPPPSLAPSPTSAPTVPSAPVFAPAAPPPVSELVPQPSQSVPEPAKQTASSPVALSNKVFTSSTTNANTPHQNISQTASVYAASQQSFFSSIVRTVYTSAYNVWVFLIGLF